jgi:RNA polymerase sigma-70 factor (ECF subfamily)
VAVGTSRDGVVVAQDTDQAADANRAAFIELIEPVLPDAYRLAVAMLRSDSEAEDAVQEAVLNAWRHRGRFIPGSEMKPWLLAILANECRRMRRNRWWSVIKEPADFQRSSYEMPDARAAEGLRRAIHRLPHDQKMAVVLRYYLDLTFEELAQILKISPKAAKSRTYRALDSLRLNPEVLNDERD